MTGWRTEGGLNLACPLAHPPCSGQAGHPPEPVMASGYSHMIAARMLPSQRTGR